jgi:rubrerythrin
VGLISDALELKLNPRSEEKMIKQRFERLVTLILMPLAWRLSATRVGSTMAQFAETEADSAWQYLMALQASDNADLRKILFKNFLEELDHADRFRTLANRFPGSLHRGTMERRVLVVTEEDVLAFLAYAHLSELHVAGRFEAYATASLEPEIAQVFREIVEEEGEHHTQTWHELIRLAGSEAKAKRFVQRAKRQKLKETWIRFGHKIGDTTNQTLLALLYLIFAPLFAQLCQRRMVRPDGEVAGSLALPERRAEA